MTAGSLDEQSLNSTLLVSLVYYRAWISDQFSGNAMRDWVKKRGFISHKDRPRELDISY